MSDKFEQISLKPGFMKHIGGLLFRNISETGIESSFKYSTYKTNNTRSSQLEIELIKHMNKTFAIGANFISNKKPDWTETGVFVRRSF